MRGRGLHGKQDDVCKTVLGCLPGGYLEVPWSRQASSTRLLASSRPCCCTSAASEALLCRESRNLALTESRKASEMLVLVRPLPYMPKSSMSLGEQQEQAATWGK